jgi:hypothetical protein
LSLFAAKGILVCLRFNFVPFEPFRGKKAGPSRAKEISREKAQEAQKARAKTAREKFCAF